MPNIIATLATEPGTSMIESMIVLISLSRKWFLPARPEGLGHPEIVISITKVKLLMKS